MARSGDVVRPTDYVVPVSGAPLLGGWLPLGLAYQSCAVGLWNRDATDQVVVTIECGEDDGTGTITPANGLAWQVTLGPLEHDIFTIPNLKLPDATPGWWLFSAQKSTGVGTATVRASVAAERRGTGM